MGENRIESITEAERTWHRTRHMFVIMSITAPMVSTQLCADGLMLLEAPRHDDRGHREWLADLQAPHDAFVTWVRGFRDDTGVYLYRGPDYACDDDVRRAADWLASRMIEPDGPLWPDWLGTVGVHGGMRRGPLGTRWEPIEKIRTVHRERM